MSKPPSTPARLASEDVIINAPMSFAGSAQRIMRLRRRAPEGRKLAGVTALAILLVLAAWALVAIWYLTWGLFLVPYRVVRRGARKRTAEALRHRELMGTIQGSAAGSAASIVTALAGPAAHGGAVAPPGQLVGDNDREQATTELREHMIAGRLSADEFEARLVLAHQARTRADLDAAGIDLPGAVTSSPG